MKRFLGVILKVLGAIALLYIPWLAQGATIVPALHNHLIDPSRFGIGEVLIYGLVDAVYIACAVLWWLKPASTPMIAKVFVVVTQLLGIFILRLNPAIGN